VRKVKDKIKKHREAKGITQAQLASMLSVTPQTISNYEMGIRTPDLAMAKQISKLLAFSLVDEEECASAQLFDEEDFKRFCVLWEWQNVMEITPEALKQSENGDFVYDLFAYANFRFRLSRGNITLEQKEIDWSEISEFHDFLERFTYKKIRGQIQDMNMVGTDYNETGVFVTFKANTLDNEEELIGLANQASWEMGEGNLCFG
jgi:transcriptional regulator with XRE-family HTH domain